MLGICRGSCFIAELKSHEKFKSDLLIYTSARSCVVLVWMEQRFVLQLQGTLPNNK
jgi:hypothetical protein